MNEHVEWLNMLSNNENECHPNSEMAAKYRAAADCIEELEQREPIACSECEGQGTKFESMVDHDMGGMPCPACKGRGYVWELESRPAVSKNLLDVAWGLIANNFNGDWEHATDEWRALAEKWRDEYHATLPHGSSETVEKPPAVPKDWTPTSENVNALPEPLRKYIATLETVCDPAGDLRELVIARDTIAALQQMPAVPQEIVELVESWNPVDQCTIELTSAIAKANESKGA